MIVLGMGTGRCGTTTLAGLLAAQHGATARHCEPRLRWCGSLREAIEIVEAMRSDKLTANVAPWWLPYSLAIAERFVDARFVCLVRPVEEYVDSWLASQPDRNAWCEGKGMDIDWAYPQFGIHDTAWCARYYWHHYMTLAAKIAEDIPDRFLTLATNDLNTEAGQREVLEFCGVTNPKLRVGLRLNRRGTHWKNRFTP